MVSTAIPAESVAGNPPKRKKKAGRPSKYTEKLAAQICIRLAEGESLRQICRDVDMPCKATVLNWLFDNDPAKDGFLDQYVRAREIQAENWADEILEIADDGTNDWVEREVGGKALDPEHISRSRLRVDSRKWLMSKLLPKKYGDKVQHGNDPDNPLPAPQFIVQPVKPANE